MVEGFFFLSFFLQFNPLCPTSNWPLFFNLFYHTSQSTLNNSLKFLYQSTNLDKTHVFIYTQTLFLEDLLITSLRSLHKVELFTYWINFVLHKMIIITILIFLSFKVYWINSLIYRIICLNSLPHKKLSGWQNKDVKIIVYNERIGKERQWNFNFL